MILKAQRHDLAIRDEAAAACWEGEVLMVCFAVQGHTAGCFEALSMLGGIPWYQQ